MKRGGKERVNFLLDFSQNSVYSVESTDVIHTEKAYCSPWKSGFKKPTEFEKKCNLLYKM